MPDKQHLLALLRAESERWQALLASLDEEQLATRALPAGLSVKDLIGHLHAWQQISNARLEAVVANREPAMPAWLGDLAPDAHENLERINAWIHVHYRDQDWADVYAAWRWGFQRFLTLAAAIPEADLFDANRYAWLGGYAPADVLQGSYEHHDEHYAPLPDLLRQLGWVGG
jgi:hypothetical protein